MTRTVESVATCPACQERVWLTMTITHDRGWNSNDGWPESWEYEVKEARCPECGDEISDAWDDALEDAFQKAVR